MRAVLIYRCCMFLGEQLWNTAVEWVLPDIAICIYIYVYTDTLLNQNHNTEYLKIRLNPDLNQAGLANSNK